MPSKNYLKQKPFLGTSSIICGGSKGIGKAVACDIVQYGGSVLILARNKQGVQKALAELEGKRVNEKQIIIGQSCDTTSEKAVQKIFSAYIKKHGVPDYLINNVGYAKPQYLEKLKQQTSAGTRPNMWRIITKGRVTKLAVAAVILITFGIGFSIGRWSKPTQLAPPSLDVTRYTSAVPVYPTAPKAEDSFWRQKTLAAMQPRPYAQSQFDKISLLNTYKQYLKEKYYD